MSPKSITFAVLALVILVDGNYPGYVAFTESLYTWFCGPLIGFTLFEIIALSLLALGTMDALNGSSPVYRSDMYKVVLRIAAAPLAAVTFASVYGLVTKNGSLQIAVWQVRGLISLFAWTLVSFNFCRSLDDIIRMLDVASAAVLLKALHSLTIFYTDLDGKLAGEWLTSHEASLFMGITLVYMGARVATWPGAGQKLLLLFPIGVITLHWIINERRVSYLGVMFSLAFGVSFLYKVIRLWHALLMIAIALGGLAMQLATWNSPDNWLRGIVEPETDSSSDYREIENFDLYAQVARHPFLGVGFGNPFDTAIPLPDIVQFASLLAWVPHNSLLMVWSMAGPVGVASIGLFVSFGIAAFVRLFKVTRGAKARTVAFVGFSAFVQWTLYAWADMGLSTPAMCLVPALLAGSCLKLLHQRRAA